MTREEREVWDDLDDDERLDTYRDVLDNLRSASESSPSMQLLTGSVLILNEALNYFYPERACDPPMAMAARMALFTLRDRIRDYVKANAPDQARVLPSHEAGCSACRIDPACRHWKSGKCWNWENCPAFPSSTPNAPLHVLERSDNNLQAEVRQ
jgi:hypothetical protein